MIHAKEFHLICGIGGCDWAFKDVTSLDIHQADIHKKKIALRIQHKDDNDETEEAKKVPTVTAKQYERMNKKNKNEHFPVLSENIKSIVPTDDSKDNKVDHRPINHDKNLK